MVVDLGGVGRGLFLKVLLHVAAEFQHLRLFFGVFVPVDFKFGCTGFVAKDLSGNIFDEDLGGLVFDVLGRSISVVDIVANAEKLLLAVGAGEDEGGHTQEVLLGWYFFVVGGVGFECELHDSFGERAHRELFEDLIVGFVLGGADVDEARDEKKPYVHSISSSMSACTSKWISMVILLVKG